MKRQRWRKNWANAKERRKSVAILYWKNEDAQRGFCYGVTTSLQDCDSVLILIFADIPLCRKGDFFWHRYPKKSDYATAASRKSLRGATVCP